MLLRVCAARVYDAVIVHMTAGWYAAVLDCVQATVAQAGATAGDKPPSHRFHLLDVGIGTGTALMTQAHRVAAMRVRVTGVDYDQGYVRAARALVAARGMDRHVRVHCLSVYDSSLRAVVLGSAAGVDVGKYVDGAYFSGSLTLLPEPLAALDAVAALVRPGGHVYVTQTYQRRAVPLLGVVKPLLKHITTIDFGPLMYERDLDALVAAATRLSTPLQCVRNEPIAGSVDNWFQVARLVVFKVGAAGRK